MRTTNKTGIDYGETNQLDGHGVAKACKLEDHKTTKIY